ncbi:MAG: ThuA domain-containing protein [Planctomycetaceae bacterium]|nr:ThuA domain-containing protein [Planctomycetaceae bacterium]MBQ2822111.1 ThuA domain-containing protein [Thermoguttaceae bacterium]
MKKAFSIFLLAAASFFMAESVFLSAIFAAEVSAEPNSQAVPASSTPLAAIIVSDSHYRADTLFPELAPWLEENYGIRTVIIHGHGGGDFENIDQLKNADIALLYVRRISPKTEQLELFKEYLQSGRPLMAFRTSSHAFALSFDGKKKPAEGFSEWREFDAEVLGGNYHNHGPNDQGTRVTTLQAAKNHPIFKDVDTAAYHSNGSLYFTLPIAEDAELFQVGSVMCRREPLTWLRKNEWGGLVFYSALGHWDDFQDIRFRRMIGNAIQYLCEETEKMKVKSSVSEKK